MKFSDLRLIEPLLRSISTEGYETATPIQAQAIPHVLEGRDLLGCAQTGTGKTAAFALPILQRLAATPPTRRGVRCLVLCPTRELALQIEESFRTYGKNLNLRTTVIFGGVNQNRQAAALRAGVDVLIATPGRLLDLMDQRLCDLRQVEVLVLDEADRMLDMGFIHDIRRVVAQVPAKRQTLLFSATMPSEIRQLANSLLRNPTTVTITPPATTVELIEQSVYFVDRHNKPHLLAHLYNALPMSRAIVFTRTKHGADRVVRQLHTRGIRAEAIHGNKSQNARERALDNFRSCKTPILVATDIASRGIDIDGVSHVVNYDLTHEPETYVHRIGRTARAGASGSAVSFCDREERENLRAIESLIRQRISVKNDHPEYPAQQSGHSSANHTTAHAGQRQQQHGGPARRRDEDAPQRHRAPQHQNATRHEPAPRRDQAPGHPQGQHQQPRQNQPRREPSQQATLAGMAGEPPRATRPQARHPLHGGGSRRGALQQPRGRGVKQRAF